MIEVVAGDGVDMEVLEELLDIPLVVVVAFVKCDEGNAEERGSAQTIMSLYGAFKCIVYLLKARPLTEDMPNDKRITMQ